MKRRAVAGPGLVSYPLRSAGVLVSMITESVLQPPSRSAVLSRKKLMSVALVLRGTFNRKKPLAMSPLMGLVAAIRGFRPSAYFNKFGIPSLLDTKTSAALPELSVVPNHCCRQVASGVKVALAVVKVWSRPVTEPELFVA